MLCIEWMTATDYSFNLKNTDTKVKIILFSFIIRFVVCIDSLLGSKH